MLENVDEIDAETLYFYRLGVLTELKEEYDKKLANCERDFELADRVIEAGAKFAWAASRYTHVLKTGK